METRRTFVRNVFARIVGLGFILKPMFSTTPAAYAKAE
jgi:DMSO/TMAO reductase YedYZ molybdopterin-dependent catalytic subunit